MAAITAAGLAEAVERAVAYRIGLAREAGETRRLDEAIQGIATTPERAAASVDGEGWVDAGIVLDTVADILGTGLQVRWHPETDRVRAAHPAEPASKPPPYVWSSPYSTGGGGYETLPGHWHAFGGEATCGQCAATAAIKAGTARGWENRPLEPGEDYPCAWCGTPVAAASGVD